MSKGTFIFRFVLLIGALFVMFSPASVLDIDASMDLMLVIAILFSVITLIDVVDILVSWLGKLRINNLLKRASNKELPNVRKTQSLYKLSVMKEGEWAVLENVEVKENE